MLNEPLGELGDLEGEMGAIGDESPQMNYIQVTPQEKEAIERVSGAPKGGLPPFRAGSGVNREVSVEVSVVSLSRRLRMNCSHH